jgi:adenylate cyclase
LHFFNELKRRNVLRVAVGYLAGAWLLVQIVETLFPVYGLSDASIRLVVTLLAIGFPLALVLAWVYELTPEGFRIEKEARQSAAAPRQVSKTFDRVIIGLLALAVGYFAVDKFALEPERIAELTEKAARTGAERALEQQKTSAVHDKSIAVLPFTSLSLDSADEFLSDGLTEELIGNLAKVPGLRVTARTSVFAFKERNRDIREIAGRLNVKTILEGSVRREEDRIRVSAQLINAEDGFHLWSESYDYRMESVLALEQTISRAIVDALKVQLSSPADVPTVTQPVVNPEAFELYLKGRYYWARLNEGGFQRSIDAFEKAIAIDPRYAPPHAGLATVYSFLGYFGIMPPREAYPLSVRQAELAIALDPKNSEAYIARGMASLFYEWNWERAREDLTRALELSPSFSMSHWAYAEYLSVMDPPRALEPALHALSLDPLSLPLMNRIAFTYFTQGMFEEAIRMDEEMLALNPEFAPAHWNLGIVDIALGRYQQAIESLGRSVEYSDGIPSTLAAQAHALARAGDRAQARAILAQLEHGSGHTGRGYAPPLLIAYVHEGLGDTEETFAWLERAISERDSWLTSLGTFPPFESVRDDPRFRDILRRIGLPGTESSE